jgi:hypothetical protein
MRGAPCAIAAASLGGTSMKATPERRSTRISAPIRERANRPNRPGPQNSAARPTPPGPPSASQPTALCSWRVKPFSASPDASLGLEQRGSYDRTRAPSVPSAHPPQSAYEARSLQLARRPGACRGHFGALLIELSLGSVSTTDADMAGRRSNGLSGKRGRCNRNYEAHRSVGKSADIGKEMAMSKSMTLI